MGKFIKQNSIKMLFPAFSFRFGGKGEGRDTKKRVVFRKLFTNPGH